MCELLIKSATISEGTSIYFTPFDDDRWYKMKLSGEIIADWGKDYEKQYKDLMKMLAIACMSSSKGHAISGSSIVAGICTLSSMAYYTVNKELGIVESERFLASPTSEQAKAVFI